MGKEKLKNKNLTFILGGTAVALIIATNVIGHFKNKNVETSQKPTQKVEVSKRDNNLLPPPPPPPVKEPEKKEPATVQLPPPPPVESNNGTTLPQPPVNVAEKKEEKPAQKPVQTEEKKEVAKKEVKQTPKKEKKPVKVAKVTPKVHHRKIHKKVHKKVSRTPHIKTPKGLLETYVYSEKKVSPDEFVRKVVGKFDVIGTVCYKTAERDCRLVLGAREVKAGESVGKLKVKSVSLDSVVFILPDGKEYRYTFNF